MKQYILNWLLWKRELLTKSGYRFVGWSYNGRTYNDQETIYEAVTEEEYAIFNAVWEKCLIIK